MDNYKGKSKPKYNIGDIVCVSQQSEHQAEIEVIEFVKISEVHGVHHLFGEEKGKTVFFYEVCTEDLWDSLTEDDIHYKL